MTSQLSDGKTESPLPPQLAGSGAEEPRPAGPSRRTRSLRLALLAGLALVVGGIATTMVASRPPAPPVTEGITVQVRGRMGEAGFEPMELRVKTGQTVKIKFSSLDNPLHSDGGGWHEFAIDELGIDWKVGPLSSQVFEFTAPLKPGTYTYYCNTCCGGKENPAMLGKLTVAA